MIKLSFKTKYLLLSGLVASAVVAALAIETYIDYVDTEQRAYRASSDVTLVVESQIHETAKSVANMIDTTIEAILETNDINSAKGLYKELKSDCITLTGCEAIVITNAEGIILLSTTTPKPKGMDVSQRQFFIEAIQSKKLVVGPAIKVRLPNNPILFTISKAIFDKEGKILGVISVGMKTSHVTGFYSLLGFGFSPTVSVFRGNGDIVSRTPDMEKHVGKNNSSSQIFTEYLAKAPYGIYKSLSPLDGKKRLAAYRSVPELDLVIYAGVENSVAFHQWTIRAYRVAAIVGILLVFTLLVLYLAYNSVLQRKVLEEKNEVLDELSNIDELTRIGNRRLFESTLQQEWSRYKRHKIDISVLLIDVDYFKPYNDNYGHQEGDKTLYLVAQALKDSVRRPTDLVARYGGEEFVVILNADEPGALLIAENIRQNIQKLAIKHEFSQVEGVVTASIGVTSSTHTEAKTAEGMVMEADIALYKAKRSGRNQVAIFRSSDK